MRINGLEQMRMGALLIGTAAALTACSPKDNDAASESASAAATTATTETGGSTAAGATAGTAADSSALATTASAAGDAGIAGTINTSNAAEIGTSELARDRASKADVKKFAADMIAAHRKMQGEADQLAKKNNLTPQPPAQADQMQQMVTATLDTLKTLNGAQFDQKYMAFQVQAHQTTLDNLQRFEAQAQNAELKAMITKAIPSVREHLERAQKIQSGLGATGAAKS